MGRKLPQEFSAFLPWEASSENAKDVPAPFQLRNSYIVGRIYMDVIHLTTYEGRSLNRLHLKVGGAF